MAQFGFTDPSRGLIVEAVGVEASETMPEHFEAGSDAKGEPNDRDAEASQKVFTGGTWQDAGLYLRTGDAPAPLGAGDRVKGPAIIVEDNQTIVVEPGWQAEVTGHNQLLLTRFEAKDRAAPIGTEADPVMLEVFNNLFMSIAEQMGVTLQNTASSVNIKERLDFSCAVFDRPARWSPTRRTCRCIWARWTVRGDRSSGRTRDEARRRLCAERALQWRHAPARHHRGDAGVRRGGQGDPVLRRLARPPCRYRRHGAGFDDAARHHVDEEGVLIDNFKLVENGRSARRRSSNC
jgi:hypothetical protein